MTDKFTYGARPFQSGDNKKEKDLLLATTAALKESEETYRKVLDLSPDAVAILQDGKYRHPQTAQWHPPGWPEPRRRQCM